MAKPIVDLELTKSVEKMLDVLLSLLVANQFGGHLTTHQFAGFASGAYGEKDMKAIAAHLVICHVCNEEMAKTVLLLVETNMIDLQEFEESLKKKG